jgi:UDP:flavonoid glycosyltransferase YjiC (YdhE family)
MKVLCIPWSEATHYFHMVPLAWAFRAAGDEVRVASQPGAADAVKRSGMSVTVVGDAYDFHSEQEKVVGDWRHDMTTSREISSATDDYRKLALAFDSLAEGPSRDYMARKLKRIIGRRLVPLVKTAQVMADDIVELARAWQPDLVISDPLVLAAPLAAQVAGAPLVHVQLGPAIRMRAGYVPCSGAAPDLWPDDLRDLYARHGVEPAAEPAAATVASCPASLQYGGALPGRVPARFVPYNGTGDIPRWLDEPPRRPRVCVTWGTTSTTLAGPEGFLVPRILDALAAFDVEAVVGISAADRPLLGDDLPGHVRVTENLPLHLLLPSCDAIIHQGGSGTFLTAASFGLPQLVVAGITDQFENAEWIAAAGAGVALTWADASSEAITAGIKTILSDQATRQAAHNVRDEIHAQLVPADVVATLRQLTMRQLTTTTSHTSGSPMTAAR